MNFTAKLALVLALLTLPVFGQSTGLPAPGVTAASCASGYFVTGWNATTGVPSCAAGSTGVAPTQRGVNAVADEGFVADNTTDNGPKLQAWLTGLSATGAHELWVPCGQYKFLTGSTTNANNVTIIGESNSGWGDGGCVQFNQDMAAPIIWFDAAGSTQLQGPIIANINAYDVSGTGLAEAAFRFSNVQNMQLWNLNISGYKGALYTTGTVSVVNGNATVTGTSTVWTAAMVPGDLWIAGHAQQICAFVSATSLTLCDNYLGATNATASYALQTGIGLLLDGGQNGTAGDFTQYGDIYNLRGVDNAITVMAWGWENSNNGVSRVTFHSGFVNCNRVANSMALDAGPYVDTIGWHMKSNNCAIHTNMDETVNMDISQSVFENDGAAPVVTTCNSGTASKACTFGTYLDGGVASHTFGNGIGDISFNGIGTPVQLGPNANHTRVYNLHPTDQGNTNLLVLPGTGSTADLTTFTTSNMAMADVTGTATLASGTATHTFATGVDNYYFLNAPNCNTWDITTPANLAYATMSTATPWVMTLHGTGTDVVKWHCDLVGQ